MRPGTGDAGRDDELSALVVDNETATSLLVHGSSINTTPWPRTIFSLILNPIANAPTRRKRPDHQHDRDLTPVAPPPDDCLLGGDDRVTTQPAGPADGG